MLKQSIALDERRFDGLDPSDSHVRHSIQPPQGRAMCSDVAFHLRQLAVSILIDPSEARRVRQFIELEWPHFGDTTFTLSEMLMASVLVDVLLETDEVPAAITLVGRLIAGSTDRNGGGLVTARAQAALAVSSVRISPTRAALEHMMELVSHLEVQAIDNSGDLLERARVALLIGQSWSLALRFDVAAAWLQSGARLFERCGQPDWATKMREEASSFDAHQSLSLHHGSFSTGARLGIGAAMTDADPIPRRQFVVAVLERPHTQQPQDWSVGLTPAERRVAMLIGGGRSNREAASELFVSVKTVESHLQAVFRKLGLHRRTELAHLVGRAGWS
jgi:DNA-binding CsgD family transcriptional regulator